VSTPDLTEELERLVENMTDEELQEEDAAATAEPADEEHPPTAEAEHDEEGAPSEDRTGDPLAKVRREAASYRVKLREAEGERDRLAGVVEGMQREEVERFAATGMGALSSGADIWAAGVTLADLRGEDGSLDPSKLKAARDRVLTERPHWGQRPDDFDGGVRQSAPTTDHGAGFADALRRVAGE
jgi:hypothetical protein